MERTEKRLSRVGIAELFLAFGLILMMVLVLTRVIGKAQAVAPDAVTEISEGWYRMEGGERLEVSLPAQLEALGEEPLILYNDSLTQADAGKNITMRGAQHNPRIFLDDRLLYEYRDELFPKNDQMKAKLDCDAVLPAEMGEGVLSIVFENTDQGNFQIPEVYIGNGSAVMGSHLADGAASICIEFLMVFLGLVALGVSFYLYRMKLSDRRFLDVAWFLLACGIWCATDSSIVQLITNGSPVICILSFYAFMLLAVPMLHFVKHTGNMKKYRILDVGICGFYLNAILQGLLNYFRVLEFIQMLFVTHLMLGTGVLIVSFLLMREYRANRSRELFTICLAFAMLGASGVLAMLLYWLLEISFYGVIFEIGILIFVLLLVSSIIITMAENFRFRTEMLVYQRLAREDRLTGMKNRLAFEEFLTDLQEKAASYENVALIFMDLNQLKYTNDCFGHNAGDELLIAAARCIENAFRKEGDCYRIGGDEFCVIFCNPSGTEQEWYERLDREIQRYNRSGKYPLSIARGMSYLREKDGTLKTLSDWKYQADQKMYENKGRQRRL